MLLANTSSFCNNTTLQHGFATIHAAVCILLPLVAPGLIDVAPRTGLSALLAVAPAAGEQSHCCFLPVRRGLFGRRHDP